MLAVGRRRTQGPALLQSSAGFIWIPLWGSGLALPAFLHSLRKEVGKGLLIPKGIVSLGIGDIVRTEDNADRQDRYLSQDLRECSARRRYE